VSARHQVNGRIELEAAGLRRAGPAEETGFLRSVRIHHPVCRFTKARSPEVRFAPDVFADALVLGASDESWCLSNRFQKNPLLKSIIRISGCGPLIGWASPLFAMVTGLPNRMVNRPFHASKMSVKSTFSRSVRDVAVRAFKPCSARCLNCLSNLILMISP